MRQNNEIFATFITISKMTHARNKWCVRMRFLVIIENYKFSERFADVVGLGPSWFKGCVGCQLYLIFLRKAIQAPGFIRGINPKSKIENPLFPRIYPWDRL
ncbi:MAG: hypothetical protein EAZ45_28330 [Oscillatoriales cyanobacterium]|nr:MAG: hypothetical protein EAZ45_28330 [Oscillatoriales cyanobacterium]